ncbi:hypothetical protein EV207_12557 [Scopulibacillus darangshiensis]|uniref:AlpA family transcriptional regulator n=1 Tax=Scopulibacillus darangshiensis TaxID=442528 RepID=A0A4V2SLR9_9BACL|nr:hypothetical protein [Scopulibacillus darangshiensis]TCP24496.1 hypothetical protein EV207_12557 [Scopulibacillus darangshiensis]
MMTKKYIGQREIGNMMSDYGIPGDYRKVNVLYSRGKLPEPSVYIGKNPGWLKEDIEKWLSEYQKTQRPYNKH